MSMTWYEAKLFFEHASGFSMDALHVVFGVCLQLLFAWLFRTTVAAARPLLLVLFIELTNEASDLFLEVWPNPGHQWGESMKDVLLTMALPVLIWLIANKKPGLLRAKDQS